MLYRRPGSRGEQKATVATVGEVKTLADDLRTAHRERQYTSFPGIALTRGNPEAPAESIAIGISDHGWVMIHSDADINQLSTRGAPDAADQPAITILFDQPDEIPANWFIPEESALAAIAAWISMGIVDRDVFVSPEC